MNRQQPFQLGVPNEEATTCYMNACITSLCSLKTFFDAITNEQLQAMLQQNPILHNFIALVRSLYLNDRDAIRLYKRRLVIYFFQNNRHNLQRSRQEDSQEFLFFMINHIEETLMNIRTQIRSQHPVINNALRCINNFFFNKSVTTKCVNGHVTRSVNNREYIGIPVNSDNLFNFDEIINTYFRAKSTPQCICPIDKRNCNAIFCSQCNCHTQAIRTERISYLSDTLIVLIILFENINATVIEK
jgi:hypothetical protein